MQSQNKLCNIALAKKQLIDALYPKIFNVRSVRGVSLHVVSSQFQQGWPIFIYFQNSNKMNYEKKYYDLINDVLQMRNYQKRRLANLNKKIGLDILKAEVSDSQTLFFTKEALSLECKVDTHIKIMQESKYYSHDLKPRE